MNAVSKPYLITATNMRQHLFGDTACVSYTKVYTKPGSQAAYSENVLHVLIRRNGIWRLQLSSPLPASQGRSCTQEATADSAGPFICATLPWKHRTYPLSSRPKRSVRGRDFVCWMPFPRKAFQGVTESVPRTSLAALFLVFPCPSLG